MTNPVGMVGGFRERDAKIIEEMLTPTKLSPDYPLSFINAKPYLWSQVPEESKVIISA